MTTVRATCGMLLHEMSGAFGGEEVEKANGGLDAVVEARLAVSVAL